MTDLRADLVAMLDKRAREEGAEPYTDHDIGETADAIMEFLSAREAGNVG